MTRIDRISALVILVLGLLASLESIRMGLWKGEVPGSGFFPLIGAGGMTLLAALLLVTSRASSSPRKEPFLPRSDDERKQLGAFILALLAYPCLAHFLGFAASTAIFLALLFRYPGRYGWKTSLAVSLLMVGVLYVGLVVLLRADLPKGLLGI